MMHMEQLHFPIFFFQDGHTPLHLAAALGHCSYCFFLIDTHGADLNVKDFDVSVLHESEPHWLGLTKSCWLLDSVERHSGTFSRATWTKRVCPDLSGTIRHRCKYARRIRKSGPSIKFVFFNSSLYKHR